MARFYKYLALLIAALWAISFVYGTIITMLIYQISPVGKLARLTHQNPPLSYFMVPGLYHSVIYTSVCLLIILLLIKRAIKVKSPFTVKKILNTTGLFFLATSLIYTLQLISLSKGNLSLVILMFGPSFSFPAEIWLPFIAVWAGLYLLLVQLIKSRANYGR